MKFILAFLLPFMLFAESNKVILIDMNMMILPGTASYLDKAITKAENEKASLLIVRLDTPGGILDTTQKMVQRIFAAKVPVVIWVGPSGGTATSAGVFITLASHIAAMSPGTTIGAAHPVTGEGKDIEGDMRAKAENSTIAMVKSIAEQRGRNLEWAEKAVKESQSLTEKEALAKNVVDYIIQDVPDLLRQLEGKKIKLVDREVVLKDLASLKIEQYPIDFKDDVMNTLANPNVAALLWLGASTGLTIELYSPGAILPGVVGLVCLILALIVSQIVPLSTGAIILLILGTAMIAMEFYITSGVLAVGGIISIVFGLIYLVDLNAAPGMMVSFELIIPILILFISFLAWFLYEVRRSFSTKVQTGMEGIISQSGTVFEDLSPKGKVLVNGEIWNATSHDGSTLSKDAKILVLSVNGMNLSVKADK